MTSSLCDCTVCASPSEARQRYFLALLESTAPPRFRRAEAAWMRQWNAAREAAGLPPTLRQTRDVCQPARHIERHSLCRGTSPIFKLDSARRSAAAAVRAACRKHCVSGGKRTSSLDSRAIQACQGGRGRNLAPWNVQRRSRHRAECSR